MGNPLYIESLQSDEERYQKFLHYQKLGLITEFEADIITRLRNIYWGGFYQGVLYLYYMKTDFETMGNKVEILCKAIEDEDFTIRKAITKTISEIPFAFTDQQHLDFNMIVERPSGPNTWVYDLFALLKFDKKVYYELESPRSRYDELTKDELCTAIEVIGRDLSNEMKKILEIDDRYDFYVPDMFIGVVEYIEANLKGRPYQELIQKEVDLVKEKHKFTELKRSLILEMKNNGFSVNFE